MATLREYFDSDFNYAARVHVRFPNVEYANVEGAVLYDFAGHAAFVACFVEGENHSLDFFLKFLEALQFGKSQLALNGKVTLPSARAFPGELEIGNTNPFEMRARFHGDPEWISIRDISASTRIFIYSETPLELNAIAQLKVRARELGQKLQFRSLDHARERSKHETPLAFICHDSRDKLEYAKKIAFELQRLMCPVWYDEFSLKVGSNLRESIERGLKTCRKCVLILSSNFFSNRGWTKKEFDSIFTREILEERQLILPVWCNVTKEQVYDYSPSLLNVKGLSWHELGEAEVCRHLCNSILDLDRGS